MEEVFSSNLSQKLWSTVLQVVPDVEPRSTRKGKLKKLKLISSSI
jgi:hypothetical protein